MLANKHYLVHCIYQDFQLFNIYYRHLFKNADIMMPEKCYCYKSKKINQSPKQFDRINSNNGSTRWKMHPNQVWRHSLFLTPRYSSFCKKNHKLIDEVVPHFFQLALTPPVRTRSLHFLTCILPTNGPRSSMCITYTKKGFSSWKQCLLSPTQIVYK